MDKPSGGEKGILDKAKEAANSLKDKASEMMGGSKGQDKNLMDKGRDVAQDAKDKLT